MATMTDYHIKPDTIRNRIELLFSSNHLPYRVEVVKDYLGWVCLVWGIVPDSFQGAIKAHLLLTLGIDLKEVGMCWYENGRTSIDLKVRLA